MIQISISQFEAQIVYFGLFCDHFTVTLTTFIQKGSLYDIFGLCIFLGLVAFFVIITGLVDLINALARAYYLPPVEPDD